MCRIFLNPMFTISRQSHAESSLVPKNEDDYFYKSFLTALTPLPSPPLHLLHPDYRCLFTSLSVCLLTSLSVFLLTSQCSYTSCYSLKLCKYLNAGVPLSSYMGWYRFRKEIFVCINEGGINFHIFYN